MTDATGKLDRSLADKQKRIVGLEPVTRGDASAICTQKTAIELVDTFSSHATL
jgi:hypothetical protein